MLLCACVVHGVTGLYLLAQRKTLRTYEFTYHELTKVCEFSNLRFTRKKKIYWTQNPDLTNSSKSLHHRGKTSKLFSISSIDVFQVSEQSIDSNLLQKILNPISMYRMSKY